jgi:hypothetical protein
MLHDGPMWRLSNKGMLLADAITRKMVSDE